jgi:hypothetical protein
MGICISCIRGASTSNQLLLETETSPLLRANQTGSETVIHQGRLEGTCQPTPEPGPAILKIPRVATRPNAPISVIGKSNLIKSTSKQPAPPPGTIQPSYTHALQMTSYLSYIDSRIRKRNQSSSNWAKVLDGLQATNGKNNNSNGISLKVFVNISPKTPETILDLLWKTVANHGSKDLRRVATQYLLPVRF